MDIPVKKIRTMVIICLVFMLFESTLGVATLYTGIMYRDFDRETAMEMLDIIKNTDPNFYEKIINPEDDTYLREFENSYTEKRNILLIIYGGILLVFSFGCIIPLVMILVPLIAKEKGGEGDRKAPEQAEDEF